MLRVTPASYRLARLIAAWAAAASTPWKAIPALRYAVIARVACSIALA